MVLLQRGQRRSTAKDSFRSSLQGRHPQRRLSALGGSDSCSEQGESSASPSPSASASAATAGSSGDHQGAPVGRRGQHPLCTERC